MSFKKPIEASSSAVRGSTAELLVQLAVIPRTLSLAGQRLSDEQLHFKIEPEAWSINDILAHVRACADVWGKSIRSMLTEDHPTLRYTSPRGWMRKSGYADLPFETSLQAYAHQREALLAHLGSLKPDEWLRGATFTGTTRGKEQTIASYAQRIVDHESEHGRQIDDILQTLSGR